MRDGLRNRAVFLDRDGTLGGDGGFCHPDEFVCFPMAYQAIRLLNDAGFKVVVVTNQNRISLGQITLAQMEASFRRMQVELAAHGAHLDGWYVCPHEKADDCACRKPSPALLWQAARDLDLDLAASWMVGDVGGIDILAGVAAGCRVILVLTGWGTGSLGAHRAVWGHVEPDFVASDVLAAAQFIVTRGTDGR